MMNARHAVALVVAIAVIGGSMGQLAAAQTASDRVVVNASGGGDYTSIQAAVDDASTGTTIVVESGEYSESITLDTSDLTIVGDAGDDAAGPGADAPVLNGTGLAAPAVTLGPGVDDVRIEGLVMDDYSQGATFVNGLDDGNHEDVVFADNHVDARSGVGILAEGDTTVSEVTVSDNVFDVRANGVLAKTDDVGGATAVDNLTIADNSFVDGINAIYLVGNDRSVHRGISITNNSFEGVNVGVELDSEMDATAVTIRENSFGDADKYAVQNRNTTATVDAEHNDWGAASGPYNPTTNPGGDGERVSANVDYDPWNTRYVGLGSVSGGAGQNVTVPVTIHSDDMAGYELSISYDSSVVRPVGISDGEFDQPIENIDESDEEINITAAQADPTSAPTVAQITFEIVGEVNETASIEIDPAASAIFDESGSELDVVYGESTVSVDLLGDVDDDGEVDAGDAVLLQRYIVGESVDIDTGAADVDTDGDIDAGDVLALEKRLVA